MVGDRDVRGRAFPPGSFVDLLVKGDRLGEEVRVANQLGLARSSWISKVSSLSLSTMISSSGRKLMAIERSFYSGYNHSGRQGTINFLNGVMGIANAQRTLNIIRTVTEFISQPEYKNVVPMFSVLNEPYAATIGVDMLRHLYVPLSLSWALAHAIRADMLSVRLATSRLTTR